MAKKSLILFFILMLVLISIEFFNLMLYVKAQGGGVIYYIDSANGNDSNLGTSTQQPWKTISKVNNFS
ncbi:MAG: right-handed parallel beta-helix repeat-containing protein, partial [Nanoarchaeota archaeon]